MGFAKGQQMEAEERGLRYIGDDMAVCAKCLEDEDLRLFVMEGEDRQHL